MRNFFSRSEETESKKTLRKRKEKGCKRKGSQPPFVQAVRKGPTRSLNEIDLIAFGSAWLFVVARLCAWRDV